MRFSHERTESRHQLRDELRRRRRQLSPESQAHHSQMVKQYVLSLPFWHTGHSVAMSLPFDGEVDLTPTAQALTALGIQVYLPIVQEAHSTLLFAPWYPDTHFEVNRYGIPEPLTSDYQPITQIDVVFLPLVGFDALGNRLGMGGGYYDRTLAHRRSDTRLIGVAHQCQFVERLTVEPWDVPLDMMVTEEGITLYRAMT